MRGTTRHPSLSWTEEVFACGRDPYFPAWPDVLQLNAFQPGLRQAVDRNHLEIAGAVRRHPLRHGDAPAEPDLRAHMGQPRGSTRQQRNTGRDVIPAIKKEHPDFLFIAEAYWDLEWELQQQGFDFCYDKRLYDRLEHDNAESVRLHLCADLAYQEKLVRFIENHDEPRAAATFSPAKERAAAVAIATLPGARLFHEGQFEGRKVRPPVFLGRRPEEPSDHEMQAFYTTLLTSHQQPRFSRRSMESLRAYGLAGQFKLSEPGGVELGEG